MKLLRFLGENRPPWDNYKNPSKANSQYPSDDCDPQLLQGWTDENPSIWDVSEKGGNPGLDDVLYAFFDLNSEKMEKTTYLVFKTEAIELSGLKQKFCQRDGGTGVTRIDKTKIHFQLEGITGKELCKLINTIINTGFDIQKYSLRDHKASRKDILNRFFSYETSSSSSVTDSKLPLNTPSSSQQSINTSEKQKYQEVWSPSSASSVSPSTTKPTE
jgi:hypothetical protein